MKRKVEKFIEYEYPRTPISGRIPTRGHRSLIDSLLQSEKGWRRVGRMTTTTQPLKEETVVDPDLIVGFAAVSALLIAEFEKMWYAQSEHRTPSSRFQFQCEVMEKVPPRYWDIMFQMYEGEDFTPSVMEMLS